MNLPHLKHTLNLKKINPKLILILLLSFLIPFLFIFNLDCDKCIIQSDPTESALLFFCIIPLLIIVFIFREHPIEFGFSFGDKKKVLIYSIIFSIFLIPLIFLSQYFPGVLSYYSTNTFTNIFDLLLFELKLGIGLFSWEFFFRGFALFGLYKKIGNLALPIHAIPFAIFHLGKPNIEVIFSFFAALLLGQIALKSKSFLPAFVIHWILATEMLLLTNF